MKVMIYHNPRCAKSRQALNFLKESTDHEPEVNLYLEQGLSRDEILDIKAKLGVELINMMRPQEKEFKELELSKSSSDEQLIEGLIKCPKLLERPVLIANGNAVIGRPLEKAEDFVKQL